MSQPFVATIWSIWCAESAKNFKTFTLEFQSSEDVLSNSAEKQEGLWYSWISWLNTRAVSAFITAKTGRNNFKVHLCFLISRPGFQSLHLCVRVEPPIPSQEWYWWSADHEINCNLQDSDHNTCLYSLKFSVERCRSSRITVLIPVHQEVSHVPGRFCHTGTVAHWPQCIGECWQIQDELSYPVHVDSQQSSESCCTQPSVGLGQARG